MLKTYAYLFIPHCDNTPENWSRGNMPVELPGQKIHLIRMEYPS